MLPVVAKDTKVAREMIAYTVAMIACSLLLVPVAGHDLGVRRRRRSGSGSGSCGRASACCAARSTRRRGKLRAMSVFHASITYLTLLSVAIAVDVFLPF